MLLLLLLLLYPIVTLSALLIRLLLRLIMRCSVFFLQPTLDIATIWTLLYVVCVRVEAFVVWDSHQLAEGALDVQFIFKHEEARRGYRGDREGLMMPALESHAHDALLFLKEE